MGMHFGILAADMEWPQLLSLLQARRSEITVGKQVATADEIDWQAKEQGFPLLGGQRRGKSYLLDTSFMLSGGAPDLIAEMAKESGKLVIGCGAETLSGSFWCVAVRGEEVLRHFYSCRSAISQPYDLGTPFPTEGECNFEAEDGEGFRLAMNHLGFEYDDWYEGGQRFSVIYTAADLMSGNAPTEGPLAKAREEHETKYKVAAEAGGADDALSNSETGDISGSFVGKPKKDAPPP